MEEKIISTQEIFKGRIVNLVVHEVLLPDGALSKREVIRHPGAVGIVALDAENRVLLVRQFRIAAGSITLEIPAGVLELGEQPEVCARRELQEETGYRPGQLESLGSLYTAPGYTSELIQLYLGTALVENALKGDSDEFLTVERLTIPDALARIETGEILDAKSQIGLLRAARRLGL